MEINGYSAVDISHSQAISLIRQGGSKIELLLKPGNGMVPEIGNAFCSTGYKH